MRLALLVTPAGPPVPRPVAALVLILVEPAHWDAAGLAALRRACPRSEIYARLDGRLDGGLGTRADGLDAAMALPVDGVLAPVADGRAVGRLAARTAVREAEAGRPDGATRILAVIDTPRAALEAVRIGGASPRLAGLVLDGAGIGRALRPPRVLLPSSASEGAEGSDGAGHDPAGTAAPHVRPPLTRDVPSPVEEGGGTAEPDASPALVQARGLVLLAAAAAGLPAWVLLPPGAPDTEAEAARRDGFAGLVSPDPALLRAGPAPDVSPAAAPGAPGRWSGPAG